jgi:hypothetical protein
MNLDLPKRRVYVPRMAVHGARLRIALRLLVIVLVAVAVVGVEGVSVALVIAPAVLLSLPLFFRRYPGERVIRRLARRIVAVRAAGFLILPRAPRSLGARVAALAGPGSGRAPPVLAPV